jgi:hypothetical protein
MTVEAGKRVQINVNGFSGIAGFVENEDGATLSFASDLPLRIPPGAPIRADGRDWLVLKAGPSQFVRGFKVVELRPMVA